MGRYFLITGFLLLAGHLAGVGAAEVHGFLAGAIAERRVALLSGGLLTGLGLVGVALFFGMLGMFNIMFAVTRILHELAKILLCALSLLALFFSLQLEIGNFLLADAGALLVVLYVWLYGTSFALRVFDFNYPVRETLVGYTALPLVVLVLIRLGGVIFS